MREYILAIDQGTTSSRAIIFNKKGEALFRHNIEFPQIYPQPGWVEHNPRDIYDSVMECIKNLFDKNGIGWENIDSIGITNQRETTIIWDKNTGEPVYNAIVWQCRRSAQRCNAIKKTSYYEKIYEKTGLIVDPYFCATKIEWILNNDKKLLEKAANGELAFGTVESFLIYKLSGGKYFVTDYSNASRTMLFNIHTLKWDEDLLKYFGVPVKMLPEVIPNSQNMIFTSPELTGNIKIPISGIAGDQQSALFGQQCFDCGDIKNTYGTGCFLLMNTGEKPLRSKNNLLTTIAWNINGRTTYAIEGAVFIGGAVVQWIRDELEFITESSDSEKIAFSAHDTNIVIVPAFTGLGSPYWDPDARGAILGITRDTGRKEIVRAALESIAYQSADLIAAMKNDFGGKMGHFYADGGASANSYLMQFQSDILCEQVNSVVMSETTALGAAFLAGLATGYFESMEDLRKITKNVKSYTPSKNRSHINKLIKRWKKAVNAAILFGNGDVDSQ